MPFKLEHWGKKAIVVDVKGHHYSKEPLAIQKAKAQMTALRINVKK